MNKIALLLLTCACLLNACTAATATPSTSLSSTLPATKATPMVGAPVTQAAPPLVETPTAVPLNVSPDVKAVLDAQKAPYKVDAQGNAVVDLQDTATQEKIVLNKITDTKTNDGLAKDIVTGYDKDGNRLIFVENYGWIKKPATASFDAPAVMANNVPNSVLNTFAALDYSENPTINTSKIPTFWLTLRGIPGYKPGAELGFYPTINSLNFIDKSDLFSEKDKPFAWSGVYQLGDVVKAIMTVNSGTGANPIKTNLIYTMNKADFDKQMSTPAGKKVFLNDSREVLGMLESGPEFTGKVLTSASWAGLVPKSEDQGKIIALLPKELQDKINAGFIYLSTTPNNKATDLNKRIMRLDGGLPLQISLIDIPVDYIDSWPQGPLETFKK